MLTFHVHISTAPADHLPSFDAVLEQYSQLPRMFIEPDGSFVWRGDDAGDRGWQVEGNLIDQGEMLAYVEAKGSCPGEQFTQLLAPLGWPATELRFELPRRGVVLSEESFRSLASTSEGAI